MAEEEGMTVCPWVLHVCGGAICARCGCVISTEESWRRHVIACHPGYRATAEGHARAIASAEAA